MLKQQRRDVSRIVSGKEKKTNRCVYGVTSKAGNKERNFAVEEVNKEEKRRRGTQTRDTNTFVTPSRRKHREVGP